MFFYMTSEVIVQGSCVSTGKYLPYARIALKQAFQRNQRRSIAPPHNPFLNDGPKPSKNNSFFDFHTSLLFVFIGGAFDKNKKTGNNFEE